MRDFASGSGNGVLFVQNQKQYLARTKQENGTEERRRFLWLPALVVVVVVEGGFSSSAAR